MPAILKFHPNRLNHQWKGFGPKHERGRWFPDSLFFPSVEEVDPDGMLVDLLQLFDGNSGLHDHALLLELIPNAKRGLLRKIFLKSDHRAEAKLPWSQRDSKTGQVHRPRSLLPGLPPLRGISDNSKTSSLVLESDLIQSNNGRHGDLGTGRKNEVVGMKSFPSVSSRVCASKNLAFERKGRNAHPAVAPTDNPRTPR